MRCGAGCRDCFGDWLSCRQERLQRLLLLRKFSNFHFSSIVNSGATIEDLDKDLLREYISKTSSRQISDGMGKMR